MNKLINTPCMILKLVLENKSEEAVKTCNTYKEEVTIVAKTDLSGALYCKLIKPAAVKVNQVVIDLCRKSFDNFVMIPIFKNCLINEKYKEIESNIEEALNNLKGLGKVIKSAGDLIDEAFQIIYENNPKQSKNYIRQSLHKIYNDTYFKHPNIKVSYYLLI